MSAAPPRGLVANRVATAGVAVGSVLLLALLVLPILVLLERGGVAGVLQLGADRELRDALLLTATTATFATLLTVVRGDLMLISEGDRVPADLRLFQVRGLQVDESALTGESAPVRKHTDPLALEAMLADRKNLAFAGTLVTAGHGEGVVWATGDLTETGRIAWLIAGAVELQTPLHGERSLVV